MNKKKLLRILNLLRAKKRTFVFVPPLLLLTLLSGIWLSRSVPKNLSLQAYADQIVAKCAGEGYHPSCYDKEIPKLMGTISMEDAFKVTALVQQKDTSYQYCHVLGHELSAREVDKDPSRWKEVVSRCPSGLCSNGCIHGGFQERFRSDSLTEEQVATVKEDLKVICEDRPSWHPTGLEQASCYHALGHLTMYLTKADLKRAITFCDEIALKPDGRNFTQLCYDGSFMQIFQPLEPEDFALIKGKEVSREALPAFCGSFSGKKKSSCWTEAWPLSISSIKTPTGLVKYCSWLEGAEEGRCHDAMIFVLTAQLNFDATKIGDLCSGLPEPWSGRCYGNAAARMIETDYRNTQKAASLCRQAGLQDQATCFKELLKYSTYNFHAGSEEFLSLCQALPEPWSKECLDGKTKVSQVRQ